MGDRWEAVAVRAVSGLANALPEHAAVGVGRALGRAAFGLGVRRRVALDNLERALGSQLDASERRRVGREAYAHMGHSLVEFLRLRRTSPAALRSGFELAGEEHLRAARAAGHGAIVGSGHLGNWETMGAMLVSRGYPVTFVVQRLRNARLDDYTTALRRAAGIDVLLRGMALRRVRAALADNRLVFFMCDQDARRRGAFVPFFGVPASTPRGAAQLSVRLGVPFLPGFGWRLPDGRHYALIHPPLRTAASDEDTAVRELLRGFNARLEDAVRTCPEQYWWAHRRWKTHPPGPSPAARHGTTGAQPRPPDRRHAST